MKYKKSDYYLFVAFGISIGLFVSFLLTIFVLQGNVFEKPWDIIWTALLGIIGTLIGSSVGGGIAYYIAKVQVKEQREKEAEKDKEKQLLTASLILNELEQQLLLVNAVEDLIPVGDEECQRIAHSIISEQRFDIIEGLLVVFEKLEINFLMQLRNNLNDSKYIDLHKCIQCLITIQKMGLRLSELHHEQLIKSNLKGIRKKCKEVNEIYERVKKWM